MRKFVLIVLAVLMTAGLAACGSDISTSDSDKTTATTSAEVTEKNDNISQTTTTKNEEETPAENDPELMTVRINGTDVTLPIDFDEFLEKTGLTQVEDMNQGVVTDGYSTFSATILGGKVRILTVTAPDAPEDKFVDTSKTEIIFPGGVTLDTLRTELSNIYPYKDNGFFSQGNLAGGENESDTWSFKLEGYDYPTLTFVFKNGTAEKPYVISLML
jgi:hypothetical protein